MAAEYKVGDKVQWVNTARRGSSISMSKINGIIVKIVGDEALCRRGKRGRKNYWIPLDELVAPGRDPLREFVSAMAGKT